MQETSLFEDLECEIQDVDKNQERNIVLLPSKDKKIERIKCYKTVLTEVNYLSLEELFYGFDNIKIITYSYDLPFLDKIAGYFSYCEIILGSQFMFEKDNRLNSIIASSLANVTMIQKNMFRYSNLSSLLRQNNMYIKVPTDGIEHRKLYILSAQDGRTRVIFGSANASTPAWNDTHPEIHYYDDSRRAYDEAVKEFDAVWDFSQDVPFGVKDFSDKTEEELIENNILLKEPKNTKEVKSLTVLEISEGNENYQYALNYEAYKEKYKELLANTPVKAKTGVVKLNANVVNKIKSNYKKQKGQLVDMENPIPKDYPAMEIDYDNSRVILDGKELELDVDHNCLKNEAVKFVSLFKNYENFIDTDGNLQFNHFKFASYLFASPFIAKLRIVCKATGVSAEALPFFILLHSQGSNCGKTFMTQCLLKMMSGKLIESCLPRKCNKEVVAAIPHMNKGIPVFIDEIDKRWLGIVDEIIKHPEVCENNNLVSNPIVVLASNKNLENSESVRRRAIYFKYGAGLPSTMDKTAYKSIGKDLMEDLGTEFYREYLKRMLVEINSLCDYMLGGEKPAKGYYPDIANVSSKVILGILKDCDIAIPEYMHELTWHNDYDSAVGLDAIEKLKRQYEDNRDAFKVDAKFVTLETGSDSTSIRMIQELADTLPKEIDAKYITSRECAVLKMQRKPLEDMFGFVFKKKLFGLFEF